jgi:hypothetical protein
MINKTERINKLNTILFDDLRLYAVISYLIENRIEFSKMKRPFLMNIKGQLCSVYIMLQESQISHLDLDRNFKKIRSFLVDKVSSFDEIDYERFKESVEEALLAENLIVRRPTDLDLVSTLLSRYQTLIKWFEDLDKPSKLKESQNYLARLNELILNGYSGKYNYSQISKELNIIENTSLLLKNQAVKYKQDQINSNDEKN